MRQTTPNPHSAGAENTASDAAKDARLRAVADPLPPKSRRLKWLVMAGAMVVIAVAWALFGDQLSFETLARHHETITEFRNQHPFWSIGGFLAFYIFIVVLSLPGALWATLTSGFLFGTGLGSVINVVSATIGATGLFLAVRWGFGAGMATRMDSASGPVGRLKAGIDHNQWSMLFIMRLVPIVPFFVANLVPAIVGVPTRRFVISTVLGIIPGTVVFTSVGAGLGSVIASGVAPDLHIFGDPAVWGPLVGLAGLAVLPMVVNGVRGQFWGQPEASVKDPASAQVKEV